MVKDEWVMVTAVIQRSSNIDAQQTCNVPLLRYMTMALSVLNHRFRNVEVGFQVEAVLVAVGAGVVAEVAEPRRDA